MSNINRQGLDLIKGFEELQLEAYPDPGSALFAACKHNGVSPYNGGYRAISGWESITAGPWTIGYGHTGQDVYPGMVITEDEADGLLAADLGRFEDAVSRLVQVKPTGNQFSSLVSFAFNCGSHNLAGSTLLRLFNSGDIDEAAAQFGRWNKSGGRVLNGLKRRRESERVLFLTEGDGDAP